MAVSKKQLDANRRNARLSTGPITEQGRAVASRNAITHGLETSDIVINSPHLAEDPQHYDDLLKSLFEELKPEGVLQQHLVVKIANCLWRYRRVINAETARVSDQIETRAADKRWRALMYAEDEEPDDGDRPDGDDSSPGGGDSPDREDQEECDSSPDRDDQPATMLAQTIPNDSFSLNLMHYEMRLDKQLVRAYKLLSHLQLIEDSKRISIPPTRTKKTGNEPISPQIKAPSQLDRDLRN